MENNEKKTSSRQDVLSSTVLKMWDALCKFHMDGPPYETYFLDGLRSTFIQAIEKVDDMIKKG